MGAPRTTATFHHPAPPPVSQAHPTVRLVTGIAGFGAGSVNLAISSSLFAAGAPGPEITAAAAVAGLWGAALLAGAVMFLAKDRLVGSRWARAALAAAAAVHLAAVAFPTAATSGLGLTQLSALLLTLMILAALGWLGRQGARQEGGLPEQPAVVRPARLLLAAFAGAVLVAGITTPGLAASTAGQYAVPHGEHGSLVPGGHHQH
ncbi:hypothetical protein [Pseudarthrobacter phenanthrenivorans]|uniref:hypothetical protein n=1 Tax=Pseudarthrobacter phenanthrenivorans TaxID=361575 RepID=UPI002F35CE4A